MKKSSEDVVQEIRKRPIDKPLSLTELAAIRDISYLYLKKEKVVQDLLVQYCCDQRFQIRVCEKAFLMTTIVPLLQFENPIDVIRSGSFMIACLSENQETHKKIIKSESLKILSRLVQNRIHHDITKYALQTLSNLCMIPINFSKILELDKFMEFSVTELLESAPNQSQYYILTLLYQMTSLVHSNQDQICKLLLKKKYVRPILRSISSSNIDVATQAILTMNQIVYYSKNKEKLLKLKLPPKLLLTYQLFKEHDDSVKIKKAIMQTLENLLKIEAFQKQLASENYYALCLSMFDTNIYDLSYYGISCIANMSELTESHDKLVEKKVLDLIYQILKECKDQKIRQQAFKIISFISLNPKYLQTLINMGMIDLLVNSLNSDEKACKIFSILSLSNLSCSQNFHKYIQNINIKSLIHILELQGTTKSSVLRAAANTLANISIDHNYQQHFLRDPEKTIILKLINSSKDITLIKSIIIIFANISTNNNLLQDVGQPDILQCLFNLYQKDYDQLRGYLSRCLSALSIVPECRKMIIQKGFMKSLVNSIYQSNTETKRMVLLSIMMMLSFSEEFQKQFIQEKGTECLIYLMSQNDNFHAYIAAKSFVLISRMESSLQQVARKSVCESMVMNCLKRERRILKEGLRFFVNIIIHKRPKAFIIDKLCQLIVEVLKGDEQDALQLGLFAFMLVSEQQIYHETVMSKPELLSIVSTKAQQDVRLQNATFLSIAIMNLSLNQNNLEKILYYGFVKVMKDLSIFVKDNESEFDMPTYHFTFIRQLLKINNLQDKLQEIFQQGVAIILQKLINHDKPYYFQSLLECLNIMISMADNYPKELLQVIVNLADPKYQEQEEESIPLRIYVLNRMSYNPQSLEYFKQSQVVKFLKDKIFIDPQFINISQYFCSLMANISKENEILNQIFEARILADIFKLRQVNNNIRVTDVIRLLAHLSSHKDFKPQIFTEEIYSNIFDHLQAVTLQEKSDASVYYPVLICILNMTKADFGLIKAISRSDIFKFIKIYLKDIQGPKHIIILCFLTISNMLIDPSILEQESDLLGLIDHFRLQIQCGEEQNDLTNEYMIVAFLKVIHNLVLCHYQKIEDSPILFNCIADIQKIFVKYQSQQILGLILSIFCVLVESPKALHILKSNQAVMSKIFEQLHHNYEKLSQQNNRFRQSLLLLLANLWYYEHSFDFFESYLNIEDFMLKYRNAYHNLNDQSDKDLLLTILVNMTYIQEIQLIIHKYDKLLALIKEIFLTEHDEATTKKIIQLFANLSLNQELHSWIASQEILKRLEKLFVETATSKTVKEQIQILLANTTFTEDVHETLIQNGAIKIFEQIINKKESMQQDTSHQQVVSLVNLGLNSKTYHLIENQLNMVNSLSLLDECEKPLQIKLLRAALEYVVDEQSTNNKNVSNKKELLSAILTNINLLLEMKSKFLVVRIDPLWQLILSTNDLINNFKFDKEKALNNFIVIIVHFDQLEVKCNYYHYLCELSDRIPSMLDTPKMDQYLVQLFQFNLNTLSLLKDSNAQIKQKQQIDTDQLKKYEQLINLFLKLVSNVAFAQKSLSQCMQRKDFEEHLLEICSYAHNTCHNLIIQSLATYANLFQVDSRNYLPVFEIISKNYKQHIKQYQLYQTFLIGVIVGVMKNRKYLLIEETKNDLPDLNDSVQSYQKNPFQPIQQSNIFNKRISSQQTFISIRSQESEYGVVTKDMSLVLSVILYVLKKGNPPSLKPAPQLLLQCLTNIAFHQENFRQLFHTKLPEYLFQYIQQKENMVAEGYVYSVTSFINLSTTKDFYLRIQPEEVYKYVEKLNQYAKPLVIQYSSSIFMQMFEYSETDEKQHLVEFTLAFMVNEVLGSISFDSDHMDQFLAFLERLLKIQKLKYKIAKIESLFNKFQKTLENQDFSNEKQFEKYWRIWNIYNFLIPSKECLNYLVKYGYFNLIKQKMQYFTSPSFDLNQGKQLMRQLQIFSIVVSSLERIFRTDLNQKLVPPIQSLTYSQRNEKIGTDLIRLNEQDTSLKVSFYIPFFVIEKLLAQDDSYSSINIIILVEVLNQLSLLLTRMDANADKPLEFVIEILTKTQKIQIEEKALFYNNIVNIMIKLFEKYGAEVSQKIELCLDLLIQHWQDIDYSRFMNSEIYQNFLRVCILFKIKDCIKIKPQDLACQVLEVMTVNQTSFRDIETQLLFQMFLKKLIAEIDPSESQQLEDSLIECINFLSEYIMRQSTNIKAQIDSGEKAVNEYSKTLQQQNFSMTIEILTILISFNAFQEHISKENILLSIIECGLLIQQLLQIFEMRDQPSEEFKAAQNQLQSFIKHISILLSYSSFLLKFHEDLKSPQCNNFLFDNILKRKKQTKIFCFNIIVNLMESIGPNYVFEILQNIEELIDNYNSNIQFYQRYSLDAVVSLIEEIYAKIEHYKQLAPQEKVFHQISDDICLLLTKVLIGKKHAFALNTSLELLMNCNKQQVVLRTYFLILKKYINCDSTQQLRDRVLQQAFTIAITIYQKISLIPTIESVNDNIAQHSNQLINIKYIWDQIRKHQTCPVDEMFFWETLDLSDYQFQLIQLVICFENVMMRLKSEQLMSKPIEPNPAYIVRSIFLLLDPSVEHFLESVNLKYQINFLMIYYAASITYSSLGNRNRKQDFQTMVEKDNLFKTRLLKCVKVLGDSKINILANFADLIKGPAQQL
ncbi:hypothetical protein pb186bvf_013228 [Paramecium bursaria]